MARLHSVATDGVSITRLFKTNRASPSRYGEQPREGLTSAQRLDRYDLGANVQPRPPDNNVILDARGQSIDKSYLKWLAETCGMAESMPLVHVPATVTQESHYMRFCDPGMASLFTFVDLHHTNQADSREADRPRHIKAGEYRHLLATHRRQLRAQK